MGTFIAGFIVGAVVLATVVGLILLVAFAKSVKH